MPKLRRRTLQVYRRSGRLLAVIEWSSCLYEASAVAAKYASRALGTEVRQIKICGAAYRLEVAW